MLGQLAPLRVLKSKLLQQSGVYLLGQMLQKAVSFFLIPVWTIFLTPVDYGITGTLGAYSGILHILLMFGIYGAVTRHYFEFKDDFEAQRSYVTTNFAFLVIVPGLVIALLACFGQPLWERVSSNSIPFHPYLILMLISAYSGLIGRLPYSLYQAQQKAHKCILLDFASFLLLVGISLFLVVSRGQGAYGMMLGGCIAQGLVALVATGFLLKDWFTFKLQWRHIATTLAFGLPIVPHLLSGWALTFVDRVMLERYVPLDEVGRYSLGYNLGMIMSMIVTSLNEAYQPYYYNLMSSDSAPEKKILKIISVYVSSLGFLSLGGCLFAGEVIALLTPAKYHGSAHYVPPIILGYLFTGFYFFVSSPLFYYKKTNVLPLITGFSALLNILLNYLTIPRFGAIAAAWNTLICYAVMLILYYIVAQRISRFPYPLGKILVALTLLLLGTFISESLPVFTPASWGVKLGMLFLYAIACYLLFLRSPSPVMPKSDCQQ